MGMQISEGLLRGERGRVKKGVGDFIFGLFLIIHITKNFGVGFTRLLGDHSNLSVDVGKAMHIVRH